MVHEGFRAGTFSFAIVRRGKLIKQLELTAKCIYPHTHQHGANLRSAAQMCEITGFKTIV